MAKYINADVYEQCLVENDWDKDTEEYSTFGIFELLHDMPPADVIERSKVDKAIEEIENEIKFWDCPVNYQEPLLVQKVKQAKANSYRHALEIIKRHIGEDKNNE